MKLKSSLVILIYIQSLIEITSAVRRFGYSIAEQRLWKRKHQHCSGPDQSPISIHSRRAIPSNFPAIEFVFYHNPLPSPLLIENDGHSISLIAKKPENFTQFPYIFGGKLRGEYEFVGLHFHWGDRNNRGSEHVINDIRYPLEMHLIHRNRKYENMSTALQSRDGLCVLAFLFQIKESDGDEIESIARHLSDLDETNHQLELSYTFSLSSLIGNINTERFYMYQGSLTTPRCNPSVRWVIFPDTLPVSLGQIAKFRSLSIGGLENSVLVDNYRHLQPIGKRKIFLRSVASRFYQIEQRSQQILLLANNNNIRASSDEKDLSEWYY